jgi:hypothetical protein
MAKTGGNPNEQIIGFLLVNICQPKIMKVSVAGCVMQVLKLCMLRCSSSCVKRKELTYEAWLMRVSAHILWSTKELTN